MLKVMGVRETAYLLARSEAKVNKNIKLLETPTGKFLITDQPQACEYQEIDYTRSLNKEESHV